jgi:hypothetical protein
MKRVIMTELRTEALDRAVRIALATGGDMDDATTVARAEAFYAFLNSND